MGIAGNQVNPDRSPTDLYPTEAPWTRALLNVVEIRGPIWEPATGLGHMTDVLREEGHEVNDTDLLFGTDFLKETEPWEGAIVTNPPYKLLNEFIDQALHLATTQVAFLLQVGALGGPRRYEHLWKERTPNQLIHVARRMKVYDKVSQFCHIWVVWDLENPVKLGETKFTWELGAHL